MDRKSNSVLTEIEFLKEDCEKLLETILQNKNYQIINFTVSALEEKCGYLGEHYRIFVKVSYEKKIQEFHCFAKFIPGPKSGIDFEFGISAFKKEIFVYEELFRKFINSGILCIQNVIPECFFTKSNSMLVFEDLGKKGFQTIPRYEYLNIKHVVLIIKTIAKIHASSLIYEEKYSCLLEQYFSHYEETFYSEKEGHKGTKCLFAALKGIYTEIEIFNFSNPSVSNEEFKKKAENACKKMLHLVKPSKKYRNVICHGDLWQTNFMMKYEDSHPIQCVVVDFQTARYAPPAHDIMAFLYLTTSREFRKLHLKEMTDLYYNELTKHVGQYGYNLNKLLPYSEFIDSCKDHKIFAAVQSATYFQLTHVKSESIAKLAKDFRRWEEALYEDHSILILENYKLDSNYKYRLEESLKDLSEACEDINL